MTQFRSRVSFMAAIHLSDKIRQKIYNGLFKSRGSRLSSFLRYQAKIFLCEFSLYGVKEFNNPTDIWYSTYDWYRRVLLIKIYRTNIFYTLFVSQLNPEETSLCRFLPKLWGQKEQRVSRVTWMVDWFSDTKQWRWKTFRRRFEKYFSFLPLRFNLRYLRKQRAHIRST